MGTRYVCNEARQWFEIREVQEEEAKIAERERIEMETILATSVCVPSSSFVNVTNVSSATVNVRFRYECDVVSEQCELRHVDPILAISNPFVCADGRCNFDNSVSRNRIISGRITSAFNYYCRQEGCSFETVIKCDSDGRPVMPLASVVRWMCNRTECHPSIELEHVTVDGNRNRTSDSFRYVCLEGECRSVTARELEREYVVGTTCSDIGCSPVFKKFKEKTGLQHGFISVDTYYGCDSSGCVVETPWISAFNTSET